MNNLSPPISALHPEFGHRHGYFETCVRAPPAWCFVPNFLCSSNKLGTCLKAKKCQKSLSMDMVGKIMNLCVLEHQMTKSTKSQINLNIELKRQNTQSGKQTKVFNLPFVRIVTPVSDEGRSHNALTNLLNHSRTVLLYSKYERFYRTRYPCIQAHSSTAMIVSQCRE